MRRSRYIAGPKDAQPLRGVNGRCNASFLARQEHSVYVREFRTAVGPRHNEEYAEVMPL